MAEPTKSKHNIPNFFIIGAPKCGTTAMFTYLYEHPNIFMCIPKEPNYFAEDFPKIRMATTITQYLDFFSKANSENLAVGEASTSYLYSTKAIQNIYKFNSNAKLLIMLRKPIDLLLSMHSHYLFNGHEYEKDFEKAWRMQALRKQGLQIPETCLEPSKLYYKEAGQLGKQVERVLKIFPKNQVKIVLFDDFAKSPKQVYEDILSFLNIPSDGRTSFPRINEAKAYKFEFLGKLVNKIRTSSFGSSYFKYLKLKRSLGLEQIRFWAILLNNGLNNKKTHQPLSKSFKIELVNEFKEDLETLSSLIDRDLSHWLS